jgi:hypothetical protein
MAAAVGYATTVSSYYNAVACPTPLACFAVGAKELDRKTATGTLVGGSFTLIGARSVDDGKTWAPLTLPHANADLRAVSCWAASDCVAVGATEVLSRGSWSPASGVVVTISGSSAARAAVLPAGTSALGAVSCPTPDTCVAVGGRNQPGTIALRPQAVISHDGGAHWSAVPLPVANAELQGVTCTGTGHCVAVGVATYLAGGMSSSRPVALFSSTGGRAWAAAAIPGGGPGLKGGGPDAVSCTSASTCIATGDNFDWCQCGTGTPGHYVETWTTANGGHTWAVHSLPTVSVFDLWYANAISCRAPTACAMAGTGTTTKPGSLYYALVVPLAAQSGAVAGAATSSASGLRPQWVYGLDCRSSTACVAVGQNWLRSASATIETSSAGKWATTFTAPQ